MPRASRPLAVVGGVLAAAIVAASIAFVVVSPSFASPGEPTDDERLSSELLLMVAGSCIADRGNVGAMHIVVDGATGAVSMTVIDERGAVDEEASGTVAACISEYRIEAGAGFGWQPTPGEALAMQDHARRWLVPCLTARDLAPHPRTAEDFANGDWNLYEDNYTPERLDDIIAAYRACGSTASRSWIGTLVE